jgi:hypothetical protein
LADPVNGSHWSYILSDRPVPDHAARAPSATRGGWGDADEWQSSAAAATGSPDRVKQKTSLETEEDPNLGEMEKDPKTGEAEFIVDENSRDLVDNPDHFKPKKDKQEQPLQGEVGGQSPAHPVPSQGAATQGEGRSSPSPSGAGSRVHETNVFKENVQRLYGWLWIVSTTWRSSS